MAAFEPIEVYQGQPADGAGTTLYTVATGYQLVLKEVVIANATAASKTITLRVRRAGATSDATRSLLEAVAIEANKSIVLALSTVVAAAGILTGIASAASSVTLTISGELRAV
jgi:hypothetical protein